MLVVSTASRSVPTISSENGLAVTPTGFALATESLRSPVASPAPLLNVASPVTTPSIGVTRASRERPRRFTSCNSSRAVAAAGDWASVSSISPRSAENAASSDQSFGPRRHAAGRDVAIGNSSTVPLTVASPDHSSPRCDPVAESVRSRGVPSDPVARASSLALPSSAFALNDSCDRRNAWLRRSVIRPLTSSVSSSPSRSDPFAISAPRSSPAIPSNGPLAVKVIAIAPSEIASRGVANFSSPRFAARLLMRHWPSPASIRPLARNGPASDAPVNANRPSTASPNAALAVPARSRTEMPAAVTAASDRRRSTTGRVIAPVTSAEKATASITAPPTSIGRLRTPFALPVTAPDSAMRPVMLARSPAACTEPDSIAKRPSLMAPTRLTRGVGPISSFRVASLEATPRPSMSAEIRNGARDDALVTRNGPCAEPVSGDTSPSRATRAEPCRSIAPVRVLKNPRADTAPGAPSIREP